MSIPKLAVPIRGHVIYHHGRCQSMVPSHHSAPITLQSSLQRQVLKSSISMFTNKRFNPEKDIPDLSGRVVLVTGGNVGIGASITRALAQHNAHVYIAARRTSSAEALVNDILSQYPKSKLSILPLDLKSFDNIRKCAEIFNSQSERLDLLFLNAGLAAVPPALTDEGYEMQFGVNHIGHQLLTQLLMPKLLHTTELAGADVRIMLTSSVAAHGIGASEGLSLDKMQTPDPLSSGVHRYAHSKLANMLFARKLAQVYPNITSTSHHPGIVKTEIWGKGRNVMKTLVMPLVWLWGITPEQGAIPGLWTATAKKGEDGVENGRCYFPGPVRKDDKNAINQKLTEELWDWTNTELAHHGGPGWP